MCKRMLTLPLMMSHSLSDVIGQGFSALADCTLESPAELFKSPHAQVTPQDSQVRITGGKAQAPAFLQAPQITPGCPQDREPP